MRGGALLDDVAARNPQVPSVSQPHATRASLMWGRFCTFARSKRWPRGGRKRGRHIVDEHLHDVHIDLVKNPSRFLAHSRPDQVRHNKKKTMLDQDGWGSTRPGTAHWGLHANETWRRVVLFPRKWFECGVNDTTLFQVNHFFICGRSGSRGWPCTCMYQCRKRNASSLSNSSDWPLHSRYHGVLWNPGISVVRVTLSQ